jgi:hypothetical protein
VERKSGRIRGVNGKVPYCFLLIRRTWRETWSLVFAAQPIAIGIAVVIYLLSFWRYSEANVPRGANTTETKTELLDQRQQRGGARDHLSRLLNAIDKFVRVINDPNQLVPINYIDLWEVDTCSYLRANLSEADKTFL